jgi:hypothetical protein
MSRHVQIALSSPCPGREEELERWYDEQHLPDVLRLDGFVSAQRFRLHGEPRGGVKVPAWQILVIYEIESDNLEMTLAQIPKVIGTPDMPRSDALDMDRALLFAATRMGPPVTRH